MDNLTGNWKVYQGEVVMEIIEATAFLDQRDGVVRFRRDGQTVAVFDANATFLYEDTSGDKKSGASR